MASNLVKVYSSDLPAISLFFSINPSVFTSDLTGPLLRPAESSIGRNINERELR